MKGEKKNLLHVKTSNSQAGELSGFTSSSADVPDRSEASNRWSPDGAERKQKIEERESDRFDIELGHIETSHSRATVIYDFWICLCGIRSSYRNISGFISVFVKQRNVQSEGE